MALVVNGVTIPNGSPLFVDGTQVEAIEVDGIPVWGSTEAPGTVTDFSASDDLYGKIQFNWTPTTGLPSPHYDVYENGILLAEKIAPGYIHNRRAGIYTYYLRAYNSAGNTISNYDDGKSLLAPPGDVTIGYDEVTGSNPETVTGSAGFYTYTVPIGVNSIKVCMAGGGGGGTSDNNSIAPGGYRGEVQSQTFTTSPGTAYSITIGTGGAPSCGGGGNGYPGEPTIFDVLLTANGGQGGTDNGYNGSGGGYVSPCNNRMYYDGYNKYNTDARGGQAGAFGDGGDGDDNIRAGHTAGGGGNDGSDCAGSGGHGMMKITWE